jgi:DNA-binding NarL/FixJ family response regulator
MNDHFIDYHKKGPTVLVAENHNVLRASIRDLITTHFPNSEIIEANNGWKALFKSLVYHPDLILMDLALPDMDGIEATRHIKKVLPDIDVIMMTMSENPLYGNAAIEAGANTYIVKNRIGADLVSILLNMISA